ncbi:MAG: amidohydrolase [Phycisphaerales bacterium]
MPWPELERVRLTGARIWTADPAHPWAQSIDLAQGRIVAVDAPPREDTPTVHLDPAWTIVPGLIDAHLHLSLGAQSLAQVDLRGVRSRREFEERIAAGARALEPGAWLRAFGWDEHAWGGERPTREWLRAAGRTPAVAYRVDQHVCLVNDAVLERVGCASCPPGGEIVRDGSGAPTGLMVEQAAWQLVNPAIPAPSAQERQRMLLRAMAHCNRFGLTAAGSMEYRVDLEQAHLPLRDARRDACTLRVIATALDRDWPVEYGWIARFPADDLLSIVGCKSFVDGTLGSRTARMLAPYADAPQTRGMFVEFAAHSPQRLRTWVRETLGHGLSPSMHAIGDEALRTALDAAEHEDAARIVRFEHCQTLDDADLPRMAGRIASMQPLHKHDDAAMAPARLGAQRMRGFFRFRDLADAGALLAFGSDWPIVSCDPRLGIRAAVTGLAADGSRCMPQQNLRVEEALLAYTAGAAQALRAPALGRIAPGAHADLCVFAGNPFAHDWESGLPEIAATVLGGRIVHAGVDAARPAARMR